MFNHPNGANDANGAICFFFFPLFEGTYPPCFFCEFYDVLTGRLDMANPVCVGPGGRVSDQPGKLTAGMEPRNSPVKNKRGKTPEPNLHDFGLISGVYLTIYS